MPLQPDSLTTHSLFHEDCLETSKRLPDSSIDLIYADPPFFTGRIYSMNGCSFDDKWTNATEYIDWLKPRLNEFKRILRPTGSIYIHCDWHLSHYIKVLSDSIFGMNNFVNEIIWKRQSAHNDSKQGSKHFGRIHDTILVYAGSQRYVWNQQYTPYDEAYVEKTYKYVEAKTERKYAVGDLTAPGGASKGNAHYDFLGVERYWRYSEVKMRELFKKGRIEHATGKVPLLKRYLDEMHGKPVQDIWGNINLEFAKKGRYPTQKPEALLERIIATSSNHCQIVYEPFAGSSTAGIVCHKLLRRWIGSEISKEACKFTIERFNKTGFEIQLIPHQENNRNIELTKV
ncbi:MAG: site-specific DNA-methyltransferase [Candidatus Bathyarchaeota archaeon]|nr:site-specific DNA-methyltransferase [Candidatus Bathyarchaeota archaeon]